MLSIEVSNIIACRGFRIPASAAASAAASVMYLKITKKFLAMVNPDAEPPP
jgi:hypothetical protein